ncbi:hypothetical protein ACFQAT_27425 [Undibacterium arcticum]|uniref:Uncharacterized protein n=1 Tax=Undibacterium arcticum TaxID=1762892 RepID=A0ABV7EVA7_9BURK
MPLRNSLNDLAYFAAINRISPAAFLSYVAANADCETRPVEGLKMKNLLGIATLILAFTPLAQAQNSGAGLPGHPDARNDRQIESNDRGTNVHHDHEGAKHVRHAMHHHAKHHHHAAQAK